jgi:hypothetical protein
MNLLLQFLKRHLIALIFYVLYTLLCIRVLIIFMQFQEALKHRKPGESGIMLGGEGVAFLGFFLGIMASVYVLAFFINGIVRKTDNSFYFGLCLIIAVQTFLIFHFG